MDQPCGSNPGPPGAAEARAPSGQSGCCANFYEQPWVRMLLGASFHPGGLQLTRRLADACFLPPGALVVDVACGVGATALTLAQEYQCRVLGIDASEANLAAARRAAANCLEATFLCGDAENLPADAEAFDAVFCECALSTFADPRRAVREMARVLRPGGVIALSDMTIEGPLPAETNTPLARWACLAGARSVRETEQLFTELGFKQVLHADESAALREAIVDIKRLLLMGELARLAGDGWIIDLNHALDLLRRGQELVAEGKASYGRFVFLKEPVCPENLDDA